jgi:uncharacterized paraquat-inducible protein A
MKKITLFLVAALMTISYNSINAQETKTKEKAKAKTEMAKEKTETVYSCPMKCEKDKTYDKAGDCPKCGMHLKAEKKVIKADAYQCPMKCEKDKTYDKEGKCPVCKMNLKKVEEKKAEKTGHEGHNHK